MHDRLPTPGENISARPRKTSQGRQTGRLLSGQHFLSPPARGGGGKGASQCCGLIPQLAQDVQTATRPCVLRLRRSAAREAYLRVHISLCEVINTATRRIRKATVSLHLSRIYATPSRATPGCAYISPHNSTHLGADHRFSTSRP